MANDEWLTPQELSDLLKIPVGTLYQWRTRHEGPRGVRIGKHVRYRRLDVEQWLDAQRAATAPHVLTASGRV